MKKLSIVKLSVIASCAMFSLGAMAKGGQHNDKYCYVTMAGGTETSSPCSARGTTCNPDKSCSIDGIPGVGVQKDGAQKARVKSKLKPKLKQESKTKTIKQKGNSSQQDLYYY